MKTIHDKYLWQLDDAAHWHDVSAASIEKVNAHVHHSQNTHNNDSQTDTLTQAETMWRYRGFTYSRDLLYGLDECLHGAPWPQIILMDYYLIDERGDQVTSVLRHYLAQDATIPHITIVGHSSVASCSDIIVQAGADSALIKRETASGINKYLCEYLNSYSSSLP